MDSLDPFDISYRYIVIPMYNQYSYPTPHTRAKASWVSGGTRVPRTRRFTLPLVLNWHSTRPFALGYKALLPTTPTQIWHHIYLPTYLTTYHYLTHSHLFVTSRQIPLPPIFDTALYRVRVRCWCSAFARNLGSHAKGLRMNCDRCDVFNNVLAESSDGRTHFFW